MTRVSNVSKSRRTLKPISARRRRRMAEAKAVRVRLIGDAGKCEICGHGPRRPWRDKPLECSRLCCHEIAGGPDRERFLDLPFGLLILCWWCNSEVVEDKKLWPRARQLALLKKRRPWDYDLILFNKTVNPRAPRAIEPVDVEGWANSV
jgi:hypothetical protein